VIRWIAVCSLDEINIYIYIYMLLIPLYLNVSLLNIFSCLHEIKRSCHIVIYNVNCTLFQKKY
jgi:hypothetical protein